MFLDEARLAARIRHPNVVPTLDVVATDGELFLVMEYVARRVARRRCIRSAPRRARRACRRAIARGDHVAACSTGCTPRTRRRTSDGEPLGIVHRDVSPQNILVGTDGVARVLDFGVAKAAGRVQTTRDGQIKGKLAYMAPEQLRGEHVDRADVYAAGVVLWEALTGRRLFEARRRRARHAGDRREIQPPSFSPGASPKRSTASS